MYRSGDGWISQGSRAKNWKFPAMVRIFSLNSSCEAVEVCPKRWPPAGYDLVTREFWIRGRGIPGIE